MPFLGHLSSFCGRLDVKVIGFALKQTCLRGNPLDSSIIPPEWEGFRGGGSRKAAVSSLSIDSLIDSARKTECHDGMSNGQFSGNPKTEWLTSAIIPDREMKLLEDFFYDDPSGRRWDANAGSVVNGASIPTALWATVGSPYTGDYRCASIVHDVACNDPAIPRKDADKMFYFACLAGGCSLSQARVLYIGVRIGAWTNVMSGVLPFGPDEMLLRPRGVVGQQEIEIHQKFSEIVARVDQEPRELSFEELERIVDERLAL
jgi:hypothetical protein